MATLISDIGKVSFPRMSELAGVQQLCCAVQCSGGGQGGRRQQECLLHINTARTLLLSPAAEIMRTMVTPVARLVAVTLASLVTTAGAEGSTIVAGSKGNTTNYSHVITLHCLP